MARTEEEERDIAERRERERMVIHEGGLVQAVACSRALALGNQTSTWFQYVQLVPGLFNALFWSQRVRNNSPP